MICIKVRLNLSLPQLYNQANDSKKRSNITTVSERVEACVCDDPFHVRNDGCYGAGIGAFEKASST